MKRWPRKKLVDIAAVQMGQSPPGESYNSDGVGLPFFQGKAEFGEEYPTTVKWCSQPSRIADAGDILLSVRAPVGPTNFAPERCCIGRGLAAIRAEPKACNPRYVRYYLNRFETDIAALGVGSTFSAINRNAIERLEVPVPPLPEQRRIVGILDEAFEGIATAKANAEKNLQNARAVFESHLNAVFTQRGEGWANAKLGDKSLLEIIDGDRGGNYPKAADFREKGHCLFLNTKNVRPDGFVFDSTMFITAEKDGQLRKGKLKRGDVVLTTRGTIGNIGLYSEDIPFNNIRINSGMLIFRPNNRVLLSSYLFELLRSEIVKEQIRKQSTGAAQPQLPIKTLVNFTIPVPINLEDQRALVRKLRSFGPETQRLESIYQQKLDALEALKKSLLHQAFTGAL